MKKPFAFATFILSAALSASLFADPVVSDVTAAASATDNAVTVTYRLTGAPAIVTFDVRTNGVSIGGSHVRTVLPSNAINCKIAADGTYSFTWDAGRDWDAPTVGTVGLQFVVNAWTTSAPPSILVLDPLANSTEPVKYYESVDNLPGGLLENPIYRTTRIVFKKCDVAGKTYELGKSGNGNRPLINVTFAKNYYLALFEFTQGQWLATCGARKATSSFADADWEMRPCTCACWTAIREARYDQEDVSYTNLTYRYPNDPNPNSLLGLIRSRTGIKVDLVTENQWEVAARPGDAPYGWYGTAMSGTAIDPNFPERYKYNGGYFNDNGVYTKIEKATAQARGFASDGVVPAEWGTSRAGTYPPNPWGFYDLLGNVGEMTLDKWAKPRSSTDAPIVNNAQNSIVCKGMSFLSEANGDGICAVGLQGYQTKNWSMGFRLAVTLE